MMLEAVRFCESWEEAHKEQGRPSAEAELKTRLYTKSPRGL